MSGEKRAVRQAMEQQIGRLRESGVSSGAAEQIARRTAQRIDQKIDNGTLTIPKRV